MIPPRRRDHKAKAIAEILALIAAGPEFAQGQPPAEKAGEWGDAAEFCAALERFCASHQRNSWNGPMRGRSRAAA